MLLCDCMTWWRRIDNVVAMSSWGRKPKREGRWKREQTSRRMVWSDVELCTWSRVLSLDSTNLRLMEAFQWLLEARN